MQTLAALPALYTLIGRRENVILLWQRVGHARCSARALAYPSVQRPQVSPIASGEGRKMIRWIWRVAPIWFTLGMAHGQTTPAPLFLNCW